MCAVSVLLVRNPSSSKGFVIGAVFCWYSISIKVCNKYTLVFIKVEGRLLLFLARLSLPIAFCHMLFSICLKSGSTKALKQ